MRRFAILIVLASSGAFAFSACGGGQAESKTPTAPTASAATVASGAVDWESMSHVQRLELMKKVVAPKMSAVFQSFDAKKYEKFNCVVCHGERIKQGKFDMPNPDLPHLSFTDGFKKHMNDKPEITKFMMEKVEIEMAGLLGMQPYDVKTQKGFGCSACHIVGP